jgi:SH3-like domain-containing protein
MKTFFDNIFPAIVGAAVLVAGIASQAQAQAGKMTSGLPLPRFVTLKAKKVNLRVGPGQDYAVSWLYVKSGLPVEIVQEYDNWRRIRDADGSEGWVFHSMLSGERSAVAAPWMRGKGDVFVNMRTEESDTAAVVARMQPGVVMKIDECNGTWCRAEADGVKGYVNQIEIWGAYPGEAFTK